MKTRTIIMSFFSIGLLTALLMLNFACKKYEKPEIENFIGVWKGKVQFTTGDFAAVEDLEFMRVFNKGGTMTESSNYDGVPVVPPAYGIWKKTGDKQYEARYEFYITQIPAVYEDVKKAGGFPPAGYGILIEKITLSDDGKSYKSTIMWDAFDQSGKQIVFGDKADAEAKQMEF